MPDACDRITDLQVELAARYMDGRAAAPVPAPAPRLVLIANCASCRWPIPRARLVAVPGAKECARCAGAREAKGRTVCRR